MANPIKYSTGSESRALNKGNWWIGTGDVSKGPTASTGFWNGYDIPEGGYVIYLNKATGGPSVYAAANDAELISLTNQIAGTSYTTINECFTYYAGQSDKIIIDREYEPIVTENLTLNLDAGFLPSYPRTGTTWYDLSGGNNHALNGDFPTYVASGWMDFNGSSDRIYVDNLNYGNSIRISEMSVFAWVRTTYNSGTVGVWSNNNWSILDFDRSEVFTFTLNGAGEVQMSGADNINNYFDIVGNQRCNDGIWHYVGWTYSSTTNQIIMYVDGEVDRVFTYGSLGELGTNRSQRWGIVGDGSERSGPTSTSGNNIYIDAEVGAIHFYDGKVLTQDEVQQNFNAQKSRFGL